MATFREWNPLRRTNAYADPSADAYSHACRYAYFDADWRTDPHSDANPDYRDTDADADIDADPYADAHPDPSSNDGSYSVGRR